MLRDDESKRQTREMEKIEWREAPIDVPTVAAAGTGAMADRADARERTGCSAVTGTVSESVLFTHHQLHQRLLLGAKRVAFDARREIAFRGTNP